MAQENTCGGSEPILRDPGCGPFPQSHRGGTIEGRPSAGGAATWLLGYGMTHRTATICLVLAWAAPIGVRSAEPDAAQVRSRLPQLLADLDSNRFDVRERAAGEIERWINTASLGSLLADEFSQRLVDPQLSYEVRWRLERWARRLPSPKVQPSAVPADAELDRLIDQLDDDSFAVRAGATRRIEWLAGDARVAGLLLGRLKRHLADASLSPEARQRLEPLARQVRGAWLTSDPAQWRLPPVTDAQIQAWVEELVRPTDAPETATRSVAQQELLDLLARDEYVNRVATIVRRRLAQLSDREVAARLEAILDWTRPAMVAEYWQGGRHLGEQHLTVGEPSQAEGATRPSHFDRIDDRTAHCVSGNTLTPGDYPSGIAFLHPLRDDAFFHLVNLPTPRRRMAYAYHVKVDERTRLALITRRTIERFEADHRVLSPNELKVLDSLDLSQVSGFAGRYLAAATPQTASNAAACVEYVADWLAEKGTAEGSAGLVRAIVRADTDRWPLTLRQALWHAGLTIAARTPWPHVDTWLAGLARRTERLDEETDSQLGATACGLLLVHHRETPERFGLVATGARVASITTAPSPEVQGYRFATAESPAAILRWWKDKREAVKSPSPLAR